MWLLDTTTLQLHAFFGDKIPEYAILSHRWEDEEVTFKSVQKQRASNLNGWSKIQRFCQEAKEIGLMYAWVDTVCIDKRSSAELSEAINSMFQWYADAKICLVYLKDVVHSEDWPNLCSQFVSSQWFTRGWTLQELVAPSSLEFYDSSWRSLGSRSKFKDAIFLRSLIDVSTLPLFESDPSYPEIAVAKHSVGTRLSWAASRVTSRGEDTAYCLLGLLQVNMPLLYGEGQYNAFKRLQIEFVRQSGDETIFVWDNPPSAPRQMLRPLLAPSPAHFQNAINVRSVLSISRMPYVPTNRSLGVRAQLDKYWPDGENGPQIFRMSLNVRDPQGKQEAAIYLMRHHHGFTSLGRLDYYKRSPTPWTCLCNDTGRMPDLRAATPTMLFEIDLVPVSRPNTIIFDFACTNSSYKPPVRRTLIQHKPWCVWYAFIDGLREAETRSKDASVSS